jgi:hypothetical protein
LRLLAEAPVELVGRMPWSSNGTFLVEVENYKKKGKEGEL